VNLEEAIRLLSERSDEAEIYYSETSSSSIHLKKGEIELYKDSSASGYGVRLIKGKHMGFSFGNKLDEKLLDTALGVAKVSEEDPHLSLPGGGKTSGDLDIYDKELSGLDSEDASALALDLIKPCDEIGVVASSALFSWGQSKVEIINSHGIHDSEDETSCFAYVSAVAKNGEASSGVYHDSSTHLDLDVRGIGGKAAELAKSSLGAMGIDNMKTNVILRPEAVADLVGNILIPAFTADNVQRNRSPLAGRLGEKLFGEIDIVDDGLLKRGLGSSRFDGEGVASQKTVLVDKGVLKEFLYDTYTGVKGGHESTGNADRGSYASLPYVSSSNFILSGKGKISDSGLVVHGLIGAHTSNPVTGDFSVETSNAFLDGKPVKKAIISGNAYELLGNICCFGDDVKQVSSIVTPSVEFYDISVAG